MVNFSSGEISGQLPKWRLYFHWGSCAFMCVLFAGFGLFNLHLMAAAPAKSQRTVSVIFLAFAAVAVIGMLWYLRRIISEFGYDGSTLTFRTVGKREPQTLPRAEIESIREWRGKGGRMGYRLLCRGRRRLYLEFAAENSIELINRLRKDMT